MRNQLLKRLGLNSRCATRTGQHLSFPAVTVKSLFIRSAACRKHDFIGHISLSGSGFERNRVDLNRRRSQRNLCDRDSSFSLTDTFLSAVGGKRKAGFDPSIAQPWNMKLMADRRWKSPLDVLWLSSVKQQVRHCWLGWFWTAQIKLTVTYKRTEMLQREQLWSGCITGEQVSAHMQFSFIRSSSLKVKRPFSSQTVTLLVSVFDRE